MGTENGTNTLTNWGIAISSLGGLLVILSGRIPEEYQTAAAVVAVTLAFGGLILIRQGQQQK